MKPTAQQAAEKVDFGFVLKGRGFQPRRKCSKIIGRFSGCGTLEVRRGLFPQPRELWVKSRTGGSPNGAKEAARGRPINRHHARAGAT